jgi:ATP phosphoribosyltransferase
MALGGFGRWDAADDVAQALSDGWVDLGAIGADVFADVLRVHNARADAKRSLLSSIRSEARATQKGEDWIASEFQRLTNGP